MLKGSGLNVFNEASLKKTWILSRNDSRIEAKARLAGERLAESRVHADPDISVKNGEPADVVMSGIVADEELDMRNPNNNVQHKTRDFALYAPMTMLPQQASCLDAQNEEHARNIDFKARNDQAQAQIDDLRRQNSTLEARHILPEALRQVLHESRRELTLILKSMGRILDSSRDDGDKLQRIQYLLTMIQEEDTTRLETYRRGRRL
ncbi:hypothetical protein BPAE_0018g00150 [Botrytis paeoniae]|uniref:Uncharacterized protein n=1 Tax=Botrytis paeoniae TaxID=278948 RepID=A0A4Z1G1F9_9HELO|nr:hypothetical protein BPAE_0018g00150 [Botrytis paeoniae]